MQDPEKPRVARPWVMALGVTLRQAFWLPLLFIVGGVALAMLNDHRVRLEAEEARGALRIGATLGEMILSTSENVSDGRLLKCYQATCADPPGSVLNKGAGGWSGGSSEVSLKASFDMDHGPFLAAGIPVFTLWVDEGEYDTHHHAVSDTFDKVDPHMLALDTAVLAVTAYRFADATEAPGRRLSATEADRLLAKLGLESLRRAVYDGPDPR